MGVKCKAFTSMVPGFALPRQDTGQAALRERILTSRPELDAQFPYVFSWKQMSWTKVQSTLIPSSVRTQISGTRVTCLGGEKPALVPAINLGREGGGEKVVWSLLQSFLLLSFYHQYSNHIFVIGPLIDLLSSDNRRKSSLKMPLEVRRTMSAM